MAYNFEAAAIRANRQIAKYGHENELFISGRAGAYNSFGGKLTETEDSGVISGICTSVADYDTREIDGKNILSGDGWVYFNSEEEPKQNMLIVINDRTFRVVHVNLIGSGNGAVICRQLQLRGA